jgi:hypothetical protein
MRDAGRAARLEHAHARRDRHHGAVGITQSHPPGIAGPEVPHPARAGDHREQQDEAAQGPLLDLVDPRPLRGVRPVAGRGLGRKPGGIGGGPRPKLAPAVGEPDQGQGRQQHGDHQQPGPGLRVPGPKAQPEMDTDATVQPDDQDHRGLAPSAFGPQHAELVSIAVIDAVRLVDAARADQVHHEPERNQQAERDLRHFPGGHAERAPAVQLVYHQRDVAGERGIE